MMKEAVRRSHNRLSAFFRFSPPVPDVTAARLTGLVAAASVCTLTAMLELAVPRGDGEDSRSLVADVFFSPDRPVGDAEVDVG